MPTFILIPVVQVEKENEGNEYTALEAKPYTQEQLKQIIKTEAHRLVTVPESHAEAVLRKQPGYQEVPEKLLTGKVDAHAAK